MPSPFELVLAEVGAVSEGDARLAASAGAGVLAFNVPTPPAGVVAQAVRDGAAFMSRHNIIYALLDEAQATLRPPPDLVPTLLGRADVLDVIPIARKQFAAGCRVTEGELSVSDDVFRILKRDLEREERKAGKGGAGGGRGDAGQDRGAREKRATEESFPRHVRVWRGGAVVHECEEGTGLSSLREHRDAVPRVKAGRECGAALASGWGDFQKGDVLELREVRPEEVKMPPLWM